MEYKIIHNMKESQEWGKTYFGNWMEEFQIGGEFRGESECMKSLYTGTEERWNTASAFEWYCGYWAAHINEYMRTGNSWMGTEKKCKEMIPLIHNEIDKYEIPKNIQVTRYLDIEKFYDVKKFKIGTIFEDKAFVSTCLCDESFREERNNQFKMNILVPKGTKGIYLDFLSNRREEQEILLNPCKFKIVSLKRTIFGKLKELTVEVVEQM